jgi:sulfoxide reductase heme-binding subunit YedZ
MEQHKQEGAMKIEKWTIVIGTAAAVFAAVTVVVLQYGFSEEAMRTALRATARISVVLFALTFAASSLQVFIRHESVGWLLRNRRYLGLSFAVSHTVHLLVIVMLAFYFPHPFLDRLNGISLVGGGLAYGFILLLSITSFSGPRRWLGPQRWSLLHTTGSYYIWVIFAQSYVLRSLHHALDIPFAVALIAVVGVRMARAVRFRARAGRTA